MVCHRRCSLSRLYVRKTPLQSLRVTLADVEPRPQRLNVLRLLLRQDGRFFGRRLLLCGVSADGIRNADEQDAQDHQQGFFVLYNDIFHPFKHI